jgi:hypothetical protein
MLFLAVILTLAVLVAAVLVLRSSVPFWQVFPALGWIGGVLGLCSLFLLPWITAGPPGTVVKNADWIASKTEIVDTIKQIPEVADRFPTVSSLTGNDILEIIEHPVKAEFLEIVETGTQINGIRIMGLVLRIRPNLTLSIAFAGLVAISGTLLNLARLVQGPSSLKGLSKVMSVVAVFFIIMLLSYITPLDTFGQTDEFDLRLLAALAENQVASGCWWMIISLFLLSISGLLEWLSSSPPDKTVEEDNYY